MVCKEPGASSSGTDLTKVHRVGDDGGEDVEKKMEAEKSEDEAQEKKWELQREEVD